MSSVFKVTFAWSFYERFCSNNTDAGGHKNNLRLLSKSIQRVKL